MAHGAILSTKEFNLQMIRCLHSVLNVMLHAWTWKSISYHELHLKFEVSIPWCQELFLCRRQISLRMFCLKCVMQGMGIRLFQLFSKNSWLVCWFIWGFHGFGGSVSSTGPSDALGPVGAGFLGSSGSLGFLVPPVRLVFLAHMVPLVHLVLLVSLVPCGSLVKWLICYVFFKCFTIYKNRMLRTFSRLREKAWSFCLKWTKSFALRL